MSSKTQIWIWLFICSTIGGFIPSLWGADMFSMSAIIFEVIGGLVGIYVGFKISQRFG